jgi:Ca2+-binding EF-hand superfamily protein
VHHVLVYANPPGKRAENPIDYWAVYVPGNGAHVYPKGYARRLPKGAKLHFQMHYTPNGTATEDRTKIGFKFAAGLPEKEVRTASIVNGQFAIPPHAKRHQVEAELQVPVDAEVLGFLPHHHLRGVAARYELVNKKGDKEMLLDVPGYDFNWQLFYEYANPPIFRKGSTIRYTGWYDNSEDNPANPDPDRTVRWGAQTYDEMHVGYVEYAEPLADNWNGKYNGLRGSLLKNFADLDSNANGELSVEETIKLIPDWAPIRLSHEQMKRFFVMLDSDKSGGLNEKEFEKVQSMLMRR